MRRANDAEPQEAPSRSRHRVSLLRVAAVVLVIVAGGATYWRVTGRMQIDDITLPNGFVMALYRGGVTGARQMALGENGTVFVGSRGAGNVYAVIDRDGDGVGDNNRIVARGLSLPSGVAFRNGALFVATVNRILRFDDVESHLANPPEPVVIRDDLPGEIHHGWRFIRFGPDGMLYVAVGAPCNVCKESDERFATIVRMQPDGSDLEVFAHGVRNSVGFDWDPHTSTLWFTDNGRDMLGDDIPPDELNHAPEVECTSGSLIVTVGRSGIPSSG